MALVPSTPGKAASPLPSPALPPWQGSVPVWPSAGSATLEVAGSVSSFSALSDEPEPVLVGGLPLSITVDATANDPEGLVPQALPGAGGTVDVSVLSQSQTSALGVRGVVFTAAPQGDLGPSVRLAAGYGKFANAFGADFGSRLRVVRLPACALTTPSLKECQQQTPVLGSVNDVVARSVEVSVDIPVASQPLSAPVAGMSAQQAEPAGATVFALTAGASSESGDFTKTKMNEAVQWSAGGNSGGFSTNVSVRVPPAPGGLAPSVTLDYSSQSVDGLGSGTNNQSSEVGDGWSIGGVSYIERSYRPCKHDSVSGNEGDLCFVNWAPVNVVLNGQSTQIVEVDGGNGALKAADDSLGWRVERLYGAPNGAWVGEHYRITTMDGTQYLFGSQPRGTGPAPALGGGAALVPVYSNDSTEPCYHRLGSGFANSWCVMGYRWNLDLVTDRFGNEIKYMWELYTNVYGANNNTVTLGYDMTSVLREIRYGSNNRPPAAYLPYSAKVVYTYDWRCYATNCTTDTTTANWPDTPWDQACASNATTCPGRTSPTFWSVYRLTGIESFIQDSISTWSTTDKVSLRHLFPSTGNFVLPAGDDTAPALWLTHVLRPNSPGEGLDGYEQSLVVNGTQLKNAVVWGNDVGRPPMTRWRIDAFSGPAGDYTKVTYSFEDCARVNANMTYADHNIKRCYPRWEGSEFRWYHKYVVTEVEQVDRVAGAPSVVTRYQYSNDAASRADGQPGGDYEKALWRFDDNWQTPLTQRTHNQWRGYTNVRTIVGARDNTGNQQVTDAVFYRGMDRDRALGNWYTRDVGIQDGWSGTIDDHEAMAGKPRLVLRKDGQSGTWVRMSRHSYEILDKGAQTFGPNTLMVWRVLENFTNTGTHHPNGSESNQDYVRFADTATEWDATYPIPVKVTNYGENGGTHPSGVDDNVCTENTYAHDTNKWIIGLPVQVLTTDCAGTGVANILAGNRSFYDGQTTNGQLGVGAESLGRVTKTEAIKDADASNNWIMTSTIDKANYDRHGRVREVADAKSHKTKTIYTPATGGPVTNVEVKNHLDHATVSTLDVRFGSPKHVSDVNGVVTQAQYDVQGRLLKVWKENRGTGKVPDAQYEYVLRLNQPSYIKTTLLSPDTSNSNGTILPPTFELFDGLLRPRRTESPSPQGANDRMVVDTWYNTTGGVAETLTFGMAGDPNANLDGYNKDNAAQRTKYTYNNLGEQTSIVPWSYGAAMGTSWNTVMDPQGHRTITTTVPQGATKTITYTNAQGKVSELRQEKSAGVWLATKYDYYRTGLLKKVTDPGAGSGAPVNSWEYVYDKLGRKIQAIDPDAGTSTTVYNNDGTVASTTDGQGRKLIHTYDDLKRKLATHHTDSGISANLLATWAYDTALFAIPNGAVKGQLASTTRKDASGDYTTQVVRYDVGYRATETTFTAPGFGPNNTQLTYTVKNGYAAAGAPLTTELPLVADLAAETLTTGYNTDGMPATLNTSGYGGTPLVASTTFDVDGVTLQRVHGGLGKQVKVITDFSAATRRLSKLWLLTEKPATPGDFAYPYDLMHHWDPAGNLTGIDANKNGTSDGMECFRYDQLRRLTEAWTQNSGACTTPQKAGPTDGAYWRKWTVDDIGNRQTEQDLNAGGGVATTWTYQNGPAGGVKPHQVKQITATGQPTRTFGYDNAGNTTTRTTETGVTQTLEWDFEGHLKTVKEGTTTVASYLYNTDGSRLLAVNGNTKTLYLPDGTELEKTGTNNPTGQRYLGGVAVRNTTGLKWTISNHQGSSIAQIDAANLATIDRRRLMPYGQPRGTQPAWLGSKGYVGGTKDTPTGLTHLGAREYDPTTGRFISADPIMDLTDPQQWHPYTYSNNNPTTWSDPTGLHLDNNDSGCTAYSEGCQFHYGSGGIKFFWETIQETGCDTGQQTLLDCAENIRKDRPFEKHGSMAQSLIFFRTICAVDPVGCKVLNDIKREAGEAAMWEMSGLGDAERCFTQGSVSGCAWTAVNAAGLAAGAMRFRALWKLRHLDNIAGIGNFHGVTRFCNSFIPETEVLLSDGTSKKIKDIEEGDLVLATDPETGEIAAKPVTALISGEGNKHLVTVTVHTREGKKSIVATANHPFWVHDLRQWTDAAELRPGMKLLAPSGEMFAVSGVDAYQQYQRVHNLTVADLHTYYVFAGNTPVLVHNTGGGGPGGCGPDLGVSWRAADASKICGSSGCEIVARDIQGQIGGEVFELSTGTPFMGKYRGQDTLWGSHQVVIKDGRVFDAWTGRYGETVADYLRQWQYGDMITMTKVG